ncbi:translation initiation factor IF-6 [Natronobacterium gregoryi]|uniref:Translation initiation factor 6 n=2 Tax=Natronobacterium gregoryi TaxID=44930 RepID=L0AHV3_NATGS|nr:translation initiation factor IF-6 [Natronobacterium gregoryi]AFZ72742.1 translation initiation factor eIF-6, putative [Natronobacterium gregoryi SP2]ELY69492.1 translation initiation factor IF-6 [Natronobacterium gregoryi SP2]PLK21093.1 translation initiation factor IF-6 [Natronobacterium gregoryi SP2]SFJ68734.1 translation initiation factor 6 (aeIF-6) [Natronobacterium gregoryi]
MQRLAFAGSAYVGVFARATDSCVLVRRDVDEDIVADLTDELEVPAVETTVGGSSTVGALATGNENGLLVSSRVLEYERERLEEAVDLPVAELPGSINAAGNVVLANDYGAYVHPDLSRKAIQIVKDTLDVPVERGDLAGVRTVGTAAVATNAGVLCHPKATDEELDVLEDVLDVRADVGTVNYGAPLVGSGLVANEAGYVVGEDTTGPELGRIEDALGYLE